jgi:transporter family protein
MNPTCNLPQNLVILLVTALLIWSRDEWQRPGNLSLKGVSFLILSGSPPACRLCYYRALQMGPAPVSPPSKLSVVLVVLFVMLFLGERLTWKGWGVFDHRRCHPHGHLPS